MRKITLFVGVMLLAVSATASGAATRRECLNRGPAWEWVFRGDRGVCIRMYGSGPRERNCFPGERYRCGVRGCWCVPSQDDRRRMRDSDEY